MRWALSSPGACRAINAIGSPCFKDERRREQATLKPPKTGLKKGATGRGASKARGSTRILSRTLQFNPRRGHGDKTGENPEARDHDRWQGLHGRDIPRRG